jgi:hypothetical protein
MRWVATVVALGLASGAGCGGDSGPAEDPGVGNGALQVVASASASTTQNGAQAAADFDMSYDVEVKKGGERVATARVTLTADGEPVPLIEGEAGRFHLELVGYRRDLRLDVRLGGDFVEGVRVLGPDIHRIEAPAFGATVDATQPVEVRWSRDEAADGVQVDTRGKKHRETADTGTYTVPVCDLESAGDR